MTTLAAITNEMTLRPTTALQKFSDHVVMRDNNYVYLGNDGDVRMRYDATNDDLEINDRGSWVRLEGSNLGPRVRLEERFLRPPGLNADIQNVAEAVREIVNTDFELLGTNASSDDATISVEGGLLIETDGGIGDQVIVLPHLDASQSAWATTTWGTDQSVRWEATLRTGTTAQSVTDTLIWAGLKLTNTSVITTDADSVFFRSDATNWQTNYSIANVDTTANALAIAQNTTYRLVIEISATRIATMFINGVLYATSTALTDATDFIPYIGVQASTLAVARRVRVLHQAISRLAA